MKKIFISLAAIAALISCVEEKGLEPQPQQPVGNQVTIKAVAAETKTILDGTDVVWEDNDAIKMVFSGVQNTYYTELTTTLNVASSEADFTGVLSVELQSDETVKDAGYAVYPSSAVSEYGVIHEIPTAQNGNIESEGNLSYASVSYASLSEAQPAKVSFHNVYSLIRVKVAEGMTKVTFTSTSPLAGIAPFKFDASDNTLKIDEAKWDPNTYVDYSKSNTIELTAEQNGSLSSDRIYDVIIFPGDHTLTIKVEDGTTEFSRTIKPNTFEASQYYSLDLSSIFAIGQSEFEASPFGGGEIEIPLLSTFAEEDYDVTFDFGTESQWLSYSPAVKGAFREDVVSITVADGGNTTGATRTASVTITGATSGKKVVATVSQKAYDANLIGEYIESYVRGFGQSATTGKFSIEKSDDLSKGLYKVINICGYSEPVYADFEKPTFTLYDGTRERTLTVSDDYSSMSGTSFSINNIGGYDGNYSAVRSKGEAILTSEEETLIGIYDESWKYGGNTVISQKGMEISVSDEAAFGQLKVRFLTVEGQFLNCYANLSDGKLTINSKGAVHPKYQTLYDDFVLTIADGVLTSSKTVYESNGYKGISEYKATKSIDDEENEKTFTVDDLIGTWTQSFNAGGSLWEETTMTIEETDDSSKGQMKIKDMFYYNSSGNIYSLTCYANLESDGKTLTVLCNGVKFGTGDWDGNFTNNLEMAVSEENGKTMIKFSSSTDLSNYVPIGNLIATKN